MHNCIAKLSYWKPERVVGTRHSNLVYRHFETHVKKYETAAAPLFSSSLCYTKLPFDALFSTTLYLKFADRSAASQPINELALLMQKIT